MRENLPDHKIIGEIPQDPDLLTAGLSGNHISDSSPGVKQAIRDIMLKTKNS
jgi:CO dehydrogenase nickel-insertion accessory protein CooC1